MHSSETELLYALLLNLVPGIGPRIQQSLLGRFGSCANIFRASSAELQAVPHVGKKLAAAIRNHHNLELAERERDQCQAAGVELLLHSAAGYPPLMKEMCDAPQVLYVRGEILPCDHQAVAIVGSRSCTSYGTTQARKLAGALARAGLTIVSGLARGIDAAAHHGALEAGGRTIAVAATGMATVYPPEHQELAEEIADQGAILTECCFLQKPVPGLFPQRNRIISGLSLGVIIIEAQRKSGSLHTARHALEQGRDVFAVPGRIDSNASLGSLDLLKDGAILVRDADDVLEALGPFTPHPQMTMENNAEATSAADTPVQQSPLLPDLNEQEQLIVAELSEEPRHVDEVLRAVSLDASVVLSTLTLLEMKRVIKRLPGSLLVRNSRSQ